MNRPLLDTTIVTQIGIIVRDIEARAKDWANLLGVEKPAILVTDTLDVAHTEYEGQPSPAQAKLAFFDLGQVSIELIEPIGAPSTWQAHLDRHGESMHHIAFQIKDMEGKLKTLAQGKMPLVQRGDYTGGRYAYVDATAQLGLILELLENF